MKLELGQEIKQRARAIWWGIGRSSNQNDQIAAKFRISDGETYAGEEITGYLFFTDDTWERSARSLRDMGYSGVNLDELADGPDSQSARLDANEVLLVIACDAYTNKDTGETKNTVKVKWINAIGGPVLKEQLTRAQAASFGARMRGNMLAFDQTSGKPKTNGIKPPARAGSTGHSGFGGGIQRPEPPPYGGPADEDLPF